MKNLVFLILIILATVPKIGNAQLLKKNAPKNVYEQKVFNLCAEVASTMNKKDSTKIAISEFYTLEGKRSAYALFLNESIMIELFRTKKFKILEKGRLEKTLKEQKLELNGSADGDVAKKVGKILDVRAILAGTIIEMQNNLRVNARLIDTGTGIIIAASTVEIDKRMVIPSFAEEPIDETENIGPAASNAIDQELATTVGNYSVELRNARVDGNSTIFEIAFTNNKEDEELDFGNAKVAGYNTELIGVGKKYPIESISQISGKTLGYSNSKIMFRKAQTEILVFKFANAGGDFPNYKNLTILVKGKSLPNSSVINIKLAE